MQRLVFAQSFILLLIVAIGAIPRLSYSADPVKKPIPRQVPVRVASVEKRSVSDQISLIGNTEPLSHSTIASEFSGVVEHFPVNEGDFIQKGASLVRLRSTGLKLRLKAAVSVKEKVKANLDNAESELRRLAELKKTQSIATRRYEEADFLHRALSKELAKSKVEIEYLEYELAQKTVAAPFSGFVVEEHTQIGEWIKAGGAVVTLHDLSRIRVTVDVPERYAVMLKAGDTVKVLVRNISSDPFTGRIYAVLPKGNPNTRTFPVRINLKNPEYKIKSGMEALVTFTLAGKRTALVVPKDAVVTAGNDRLVYAVVDGRAIPVNVSILGYYDGDVSVAGKLTPGARVVVRGNERLRPGIPVQILK